MPQTVLEINRPRGQERRRHPRTHVSMGMECVFFDPDGPRVMDHMDMVDLSRSGVGALSKNRYYPGQRVMICLPAAGDGSDRSMYATVARCIPDREGGYHIGLSFDAATGAGSVDVSHVMRAAA